MLSVCLYVCVCVCVICVSAESVTNKYEHYNLWLKILEN